MAVLNNAKSSEVEGGCVAVNCNQVEALPPYLKRAGLLKPLKPEDLGDGGALPAFHYVQYPLGMGMTKSKPGNNTLPLTVDECGKLRYDAIVRQDDDNSSSAKKKKIVYSQHSDLVPVFAKDNTVEQDEVDDKQKEIDETTRRTKAALEQIANVRLSAVQPKNESSASKFIKYKPSQPQLQSAAFNSGAKERIIRMVEMPEDPLESPKLKHKRVIRASGSPPVPVMHSPPRPLTVKDQQEWNKIAPCISNWKNPKGYTIPLDKRVATDGRGLQEVQINENFAKLAEALRVGEQKAREGVAVRSKVLQETMMKEKEKKEMELRVLAHKARSERTVAGTAMPCERSGGANDGDMSVDYERVGEEKREEKDERIRREKIREERRRERGRERRLEDKDAALGKKSKISRDRDRDISEKVALGMASIGAKVVYDERVFNQEKGMDSGFGTDDAYNIYDKGMFTCWQSALTTLYRPKKDTDDEMYGGADNDEQLDKIKKTERSKVDRVFTGTDERSGRPRDNRHVEFDKEEVADQEDPFGLDQR